MHELEEFAANIARGYSFRSNVVIQLAWRMRNFRLSPAADSSSDHANETSH